MSHEGPPQFKKPPSTSESKLPSEQKAAMKASAQFGKQIQETCPGIAIDYINGSSLSKLVEKYDIQSKFGIINIRVAKNAVRNALNGYSGNFSLPYPGLIKDPDILGVIGKKHKKDASIKIGENARDKGTGIFAMTKERRREVSTVSGRNLHTAGKGIHAQTIEERRVVGKKGIEAMGFTPFSKEEEAFLEGIDLNNEQYQTRNMRIYAKKITEELNNRFHGGNNIRNRHSVGQFLRKMKKQNSTTK